MRIFSLLVENKPGVLFRVASHFRRKNYNIESISVGPTEDRTLARMTITMVADEEKADSFARLLKRTVDVIEITRMNWDRALLSELAQIKIRTDGLHERRSVLAMVGTWGARVIEMTEKTVCVEITGSPGKIDEYVEMAAEFGIVGVSRTGVTALAKG